jgi:spore coat polysaccharide biosynthesis protein SpsF
MRVVVVIQARMGSTRLPGKVLAELGGLPVLSWVVRACLAATQVDGVVVATTRLEIDDPVADHARSLGVPVVRGSEDDVLSRYVAALDEHPCDAVVRITADCPLMDPAIIDQVVAAWRADPSLDYLSTVVVRTLPHGLDVELVTADALRRVERTAQDHHRVHVTSAIYTAPDRFAVAGLVFAPDTTDLRITLDTPADLVALRAIVEELGPGTASRRDVVGLLRRRPDLVALNADVAQKALDAG